MSSLANKVAIVTSASKGIGSGIAQAFAAAGARVAVNYSSDRKRGERVAQTIVDSYMKDTVLFGVSQLGL